MYRQDTGFSNSTAQPFYSEITRGRRSASRRPVFKVVAYLYCLSNRNMTKFVTNYFVKVFCITTRKRRKIQKNFSKVQILKCIDC